MGCVIAASIASGLTYDAEAQPEDPEYRIHDVTGTESVGFGMNDAGAIVGTYLTEDSQSNPVWHGFLWTPTQVTGLPGTFIDLNTAAGLSDDVWSAGYDVNNAGQVVGVIWDEDNGNFERVAYVWNFPADSGNGAFGTIPGLGSVDSAAFAISDDSPEPVIVGQHLGSGTGPVSGSPNATEIEYVKYQTNQAGFHFVLEDDTVIAGDLSTLPPPSAHPNWATGGYDVAPGTAHTVNDIPISGSIFNDQFSCSSGYCDGQFDASCAVGAGWEQLTGTDLEGLIVDSAEIETAGLGVNDAEQHVGWAIGAAVFGTDDCDQFAAYWDDPTVTVPMALPALNGSAVMTAHQISNLLIDVKGEDQRHVIGNDDENSLALIWLHVDGSGSPTNPTYWDGDLLENFVCEWAQQEYWDRLATSFDINEPGWIVGTGLLDTSLERRAYLLEPMPLCEGDYDSDGDVDVDDLLLLLGAWGSLSFGSSDCDPTVGVDDLLGLLAHWGPCGSAPTDVPETVEDCLEKFSLGTPELEACLEAVQ